MSYLKVVYLHDNADDENREAENQWNYFVTKRVTVDDDEGDVAVKDIVEKTPLHGMSHLFRERHHQGDLLWSRTILQEVEIRSRSQLGKTVPVTIHIVRMTFKVPYYGYLV